MEFAGFGCYLGLIKISCFGFLTFFIAFIRLPSQASSIVTASPRLSMGFRLDSGFGQGEKLGVGWVI